MPELSIIVPVYKVEKYLSRCVDSILNQSFSDFELMLIDDGSPDSSGKICDRYSKTDVRVKVIHQENKGVSSARNAGLDIASGRYIAFIDADDYIEPKMYEIMMSVIKKKNVDVVICGAKSIIQGTSEIRKEMLSEGYYDKAHLLNSLFEMPNPLGGCIWNKLVKSDVLKNCRYKTGVSMAEDRMFLLDYFQNCESGYKIPDSLYIITERDDSATHSRTVVGIRHMLDSSRFMMVIARKISFELGCSATVKYLDDCVRYIRELKTLKKNRRITRFFYFFLYQSKMLYEILYSYLTKQISRAKATGFLYEWANNYRVVKSNT